MDFNKVWADNGTHGFLAIVPNDFCEQHIVLLKDDFSTCIFEQDGVVVIVQGGILSALSANTIHGMYIANPISFVPNRTTIGSFLIIDKPRHRFIAGRDRAQAYHLYIAEQNNNWFITTNMLPLCEILDTNLDAYACDMFLLKGIVLAPFPLLKGVKAVLPGHYIFGEKNHDIKEAVFWEISNVEVPENYREGVKLYGELLTTNIKRHIFNDAAGVFLSGGSDSAAVMGVLDKLKVSDVQAVHMETGNFPDETVDIANLKRTYKFHLENVYPPGKTLKWKEEIDIAIETSQPGAYKSFPMYSNMGKKMNELLIPKASIFNGEMVLLDQGFNVSSDNNRNFKRWLYYGAGRHLSKVGPILPDFMKPQWSNVRQPLLKRDNYYHIYLALSRVGLSFLYSMGRPHEYYSGLKMGFKGYPGTSSLISFLDKDYNTEKRELECENFFKGYSSGFNDDCFRAGISNLATAWYSEASNFSMPLDASALGKHPICFSFSSVELMDFAVSIPLDWTIDKKIQKDMCFYELNMPKETSYRLKYHKMKVNYFDVVFGQLFEIMKEEVMGFDFGPLDKNIKIYLLSNKSKEQKDEMMFNLYGLLRIMKKYNLKIR